MMNEETGVHLHLEAQKTVHLEGRLRSPMAQFSELPNVDALQSPRSSLASSTVGQYSKTSHVPVESQAGSPVHSLEDRVRQLEKKLEDTLNLRPPDSAPSQPPIRMSEHGSINGRY